MHTIESLTRKNVDVDTVADPRQVFIDCRRAIGVNDDDVRTISRIVGLRTLYLTGCGISDVGIGWLKGNPGLEHLDLGETRATCNSLGVVATLPSIAGVSFARITIPDSYDIAPLLRLPSLRVVNLSYTNIGIEKVKQLLMESRITNLDLEGNDLCRETLALLDDIDAEPYRTVSIDFGNNERLAIVLPDYPQVQ